MARTDFSSRTFELADKFHSPQPSFEGSRGRVQLLMSAVGLVSKNTRSSWCKMSRHEVILVNRRCDGVKLRERHNTLITDPEYLLRITT